MGIFDKLFGSNESSSENIYDYIKKCENLNKEIVRLKVIFKDNPVGLAIDEIEGIKMSSIFKKDESELKRAIKLATVALKYNCTTNQKAQLMELLDECQQKLNQ